MLIAQLGALIWWNILRALIYFQEPEASENKAW